MGASGILGVLCEIYKTSSSATCRLAGRGNAAFEYSDTENESGG
jgi:hypothetical protein